MPAYANSRSPKVTDYPLKLPFLSGPSRFVRWRMQQQRMEGRVSLFLVISNRVNNRTTMSVFVSFNDLPVFIAGEMGTVQIICLSKCIHQLLQCYISKHLNPIDTFSSSAFFVLRKNLLLQKNKDG